MEQWKGGSRWCQAHTALWVDLLHRGPDERFPSSAEKPNKAIFLCLPRLQAGKPSYSARLFHFSFCETSSLFLNLTTSEPKQFCETSSIFALNLTTSKMKQFCETSSIFQFDNIKNKAILRDFLQKWKVECSADGLVAMCFAIFPLHLSKVLRLPRKIDARSYEELDLSRKIIFANQQIWCSKMQRLSGNQRPDLLTSLMNMSFVLRLPREMHLCRSSSNVPRLPSFLTCYKTLAFCSLLTRCAIPCACHAKRHLNFQKWRVHVVVCTFWLRNVLRATTASTFSTSQLPKVAPSMVCFVHFDFQMCFAPQRRAIFHLSSDHMAPHPPLSEPTFRPSGGTHHWKNTVFRDFPTFSCTCIFFLRTLSLLWSSLFSSLRSDSSHLCFSSVHIVGSLTSKLPSIILVSFFLQRGQGYQFRRRMKQAQSVSGAAQTHERRVGDLLHPAVRHRRAVGNPRQKLDLTIKNLIGPNMEPLLLGLQRTLQNFRPFHWCCACLSLQYDLSHFKRNEKHVFWWFSTGRYIWHFLWVRYGGYTVGTVRWVRWVRYGGYTVGTVRWVRWVRYSGYSGYGTVGTVVRYGGYGGYGTVGAGTHPPYPEPPIVLN